MLKTIYVHFNSLMIISNKTLYDKIIYHFNVNCKE